MLVWPRMRLRVSMGMPRLRARVAKVWRPTFGLPATYLFFFIKFEKSKHYIDDFFLQPRLIIFEKKKDDIIPKFGNY